MKEKNLVYLTAGLYIIGIILSLVSNKLIFSLIGTIILIISLLSRLEGEKK